MYATVGLWFSYISPFLFTRTLLPLLTETAQEAESDVRIVNVCISPRVVRSDHLLLQSSRPESTPIYPVPCA